MPMPCLLLIGRFLNIALVKSEGLPPDDLDLLKKFFVNVVGIPDCLGMGELGGLLYTALGRFSVTLQPPICNNSCLRGPVTFVLPCSSQESLTQQDLEARLRVPLSQEKIGVSNRLGLQCGENMKNIDLVSLESATYCTQLTVTSGKLGGCISHSLSLSKCISTYAYTYIYIYIYI